LSRSPLLFLRSSYALRPAVAGGIASGGMAENEWGGEGESAVGVRGRRGTRETGRRGSGPRGRGVRRRRGRRRGRGSRVSTLDRGLGTRGWCFGAKPYLPGTRRMTRGSAGGDARTAPDTRSARRARLDDTHEPKDVASRRVRRSTASDARADRHRPAAESPRDPKKPGARITPETRRVGAAASVRRRPATRESRKACRRTYPLRRQARATTLRVRLEGYCDGGLGLKYRRPMTEYMPITSNHR